MNQDWFITPEEALLAPAEDDETRSRRLRGDGPGIEILKPVDGEVISSPAEILVRFIRKAMPIDLTSLKVTLLKFIAIDLTDRIKAYASLEGIALKDAKVPTGTYRVRISLADIEGEATTKEVSFEIR